MSRFLSSRFGLSLVVLGAVLAPGFACVPTPTPCPPAEDDAGCTGQRWISIGNPSAPCPADSLGIWAEEKLFKGPVGGPPPALARYCVYEWTGARVNPGATQCLPYGANGPGDDEINHLQTVVAAGAELGEDCIDTAPLGFEEDAAGWARKSLTRRAGGVDSLAPSAMDPTLPRPARVVAVDTSPDALSGGIAVGQSRHGDTVAHVARDVACPNTEAAPCAAHVTTALGLPRADLANPLVTSPAQGGFFGTEGDLAQAIERSVLSWRTEVAAGQGDPRLVLNLSVGWEDDPERNNCAPAQLAQNPDSLAPPARAVLDAMRYAACHGALLLAAAGNDTGGPKPASGLVCPARWEVITTPDTTTCNALVGTKFIAAWAERWPSFPRRPASAQAYDRVVYAVGGVDYNDAPLVPSRPLARPRLAALGLLAAGWDMSSNAAVTPNTNGQPPTAPPLLTGTSVATAVASAIAAGRWAYNPAATAPEILDAIYQSGVVLQQNGSNIRADPDTCVGTSACAVHRLSLCRALGVPCDDAAPVGAQNDPLPNPALASTLLATLAGEFNAAIVSQASFPDTLPIPSAGHPTVAASPWTFPQPNWPACPACVLAVDGPNNVILYARPGVTMTDLTLVIVDRQGIVRSARVAATAQRNDALRITITPQTGFSVANARSVWLSGTATTQSGSPVSVVQQIAVTGL
ncbi:S8 family serine peptidase [Polyangium sorediatum]|uniref:S8 family serine peptidase n=1 Tax=Polyangium sorediatum TaxID=889274 RepID=A0ABT6P6S0_9BACT|nr:S8 family serine peptidase [Polyangium sorediatum]MDI1435875.1 S8 family serine peptidase [Polyangium sorediatum]